MTPRYAVTIVTRDGYAHSEAFREIAEAVYFGLASEGQDVVISSTVYVPGRVPIVFGANLLTAPAELPADAIIYNLEQVDTSSSWFTGPYLTLLRAHQVWDYSHHNVIALRSLGVTNIHHVPIGYVKELERIPDNPKDIDVLFYGSINPRRQKIIEQLHAANLKVSTVFGLYGSERDALISRSRVVLNVHFYETRIFEIVRVSYLLANGACVLSEDGDDPIEDDFHDAVAFSTYDQLVNRCIELLDDDALRESYGRNGRQLMRTRPQGEYLRPAIAAAKTTHHNVLTLPMILNVGSGKDWRADCVNLDIADEWDPDIIFDLNQGLPASGVSLLTQRFGELKFIDDTFELIICNDVLEHLIHLSTAMTTFLRILKPGGVLRISVPYDLSWGAWQDPTHVRAFNERSWLYYTEWSWYMHWDTWKFDLKSLKFALSQIGQQLMAQGVEQDTVLRTPRAVDSMQVELMKRLLNDEESREYSRRHART